MENSFKTLALNSKLHQNLDSLGFSSMTPIQAEALPFILEGHDLIAKAKTGSGKTATFGLGILNKIEIEKKKLQALVICPTRELAVQVAEELRRLARNIPNCKILVITGGASEYQQLNSLDHGAHIIVGTPGRLLKFLNKGAIELETISFLVLDEADRMLDMGFQEDMEKIISYSPKNKQTLLFSATFPLEIEELSANILVDPKKVEVDSKHEKNIIKQIFVEVSDHKQKSEALVRLLGEYKPASTVVFCKTKQICGDVAKFLGREGISALPIHGDLEQNERTVVLTKFSNHSCLVLVATDVAARGLDIKDLEAVINFDLPNDADTYTHRIGRTARAGKVGLAFSLFV
ncbi:MAG: ATP-dependent RNA helicase DbpA, partial [Bacteriovoracaceae bacterium]|nr:ATP-dependent RNA helicase DbpA [Bacteriovoracaceae bacterium]